MTVTGFIQQAISAPDALMDAGIEASGARLATAHDTLRAARAKLIDAQAAESELDGRQSALSVRIAELKRKVSDLRPLIGITKGKPEALATAARRHAETEREHRYALLALDVLIAGERLPGALDVKRAECDIARAECDWIRAKGEILTRELWRPLAMAADRDPAIELTLQPDSQVATLVRDLGARQANISAQEADILRDAAFMGTQQRAAGLIS
jgi:hypothetical protein